MTNTATKLDQVAVIEHALAYYEVEADDARAAAENWQDGEFDGRDDEALDTEGPCRVRERQPDGSWRKVPRPEWAEPTGQEPYSVLLRYPDHLDDTGSETFYAFVVAADPLDAVAAAQRQAATAQSIEIDDPADFHPLLVTAGHHASEPLFNQ